ncbi:MAG: nucleoside hydrolase [Bacteroidales bacterium]|jgi:pyrimidine-specific ribonucleoside hydrolase|nr:nucleoside hydrolase [Bacteroidales bacterium]
MKKIIILLAAMLITSPAFTHPWKPAHYVIVDTEAGIDDIKAITMLLASPDVRVEAITVSPGALDTGTGYLKIKSLLNSYGHQGIPVWVNRSCNYVSPRLRVAEVAKWGDEAVARNTVPADFLPQLRHLLSIEENSLTMVCLGGLSTASQALDAIPKFRQKVKRIVWSADGIDDTKGFNYSIDPQAANRIMQCGIPLTVVKPLAEGIFYTDELAECIKTINNKYSSMLGSLFALSAPGHTFPLTLVDDAVPLYIHYPQYFSTDSASGSMETSPLDTDMLREQTIKIISGETTERNQVIKSIPIAPAFYFADVEPYVEDIIGKYGIDEWTSGVFANELHRHLGVYAIIGVKMGIRAREYFNTGVDEFRVTSFAGSTPPLSCMNDGLQVSTGATPGHGLLTVRNDAPLPSAEFTYMGRTIRLTLNSELAQSINSELKEINFVNGLDSNIYWELVRQNAIKYWFRFDRRDIFTVEELPVH